MGHACPLVHPPIWPLGAPPLVHHPPSHLPTHLSIIHPFDRPFIHQFSLPLSLLCSVPRSPFPHPPSPTHVCVVGTLHQALLWRSQG